VKRTAELTRVTRETKVGVSLAIDGSGKADISTGIGFYDHLLSTLAYHGMFDVTIETIGDLEVDDHHTVEDTALLLGEAFDTSLGDRAGIVRFGEATVPMDEALGRCAIDAGGRPYLVSDLAFAGERIGALSTQMISHSLESFTRSARITLHVTATGRNDHHTAEAAFKSIGRALRVAVESDPRRSGVSSTKGVL
jgi:imidazoleglycerol-phosphate dehydratase